MRLRLGESAEPNSQSLKEATRLALGPPGKSELLYQIRRQSLRYIASKPTPLGAKYLHVDNLGEPGFTLPLVVQK
jgi:hypothetical protein